jgi:hypothetical protein
LRQVRAQISRILLSVCLLSEAGVSHASITDSDPPWLYVQRADAIALIEIQKREDFRCNDDGVERSCGTVYTAKVIDAVKGPTSTLVFYSNLPSAIFSTSPLVVLAASGSNRLCRTHSKGEMRDCQDVGQYQLILFYGAVSRVKLTNNGNDQQRLVNFGELDSWFRPDNPREITTDSEGHQFVTWEYMRSSILRWMASPPQ